MSMPSASSSAFAILDRQRAVFKSVLSKSSPASSSCEWKVLVCDTEARSIIDALFSPLELRSFGVTLKTIIDAPRGPVPGAPALYFVAATPRNVAWITKDISPKSPLYNFSSVAFLTAVSSSLLTAFSAQLPIPSPLTNVFDLHAQFVSLEQNLFTLNEHNSYARTVLAEQDQSNFKCLLDRVVDGLFSVLVTLGTIPIIRAQRNSPAQVVAAMLDARVRENLHLFQRVSLSSRALSFRRPLLLLLDRSIDFNPLLYHTWTYQALVHDCLNMHLNRITINVSSPDSDSETKRTYDLEKSTDSFWKDNASSPFPVVAEAVEAALTKYRENVDNINKRSTSSSNGDANEVDDSFETSQLAEAISSLPELTRQKDTINKHTNIATTLLNNINSRSLDTFYELESQLMNELHRPLSSQSPDAYKAAITRLLRGGIGEEDTETQRQGSASDRLRMFLIYYDVFGDRFSAGDMTEYKQLLKAAGADVSVIDYFAKLKGYQHERLAPPSPSNGSLNTATLTRLMNRMVHRGYRSITNVAQSAKKLVSDQSNSFVTARTLEVFMKESARDRDPSFSSDILDNFLLFDPKIMPSAESLQPAERPTIAEPEDPVRRKTKHMVFNDAIMFTMGGGNYAEFENCLETIASNTPKRDSPNLLYGTTEMITAEAFLGQIKGLVKEAADRETASLQ